MLRVVPPEPTPRIARARGSNTTPELAVRKILTKLGIKYRTCVRLLPGAPDIANRSAGWAMFVNRCCRHGHAGCSLAPVPKMGARAWREDCAANRRRDQRKVRALHALGLRVISVWQCELEDPDGLERRLRRVLTEKNRLEMGGDDRKYLRSARRSRTIRPAAVRLVDLFCGCGGLSLGVEEAARVSGFALEVRLAVEADAAVVATYAANFSPAHGVQASDVRDWFDGAPGDQLSLLERRTRKNVGSVDILVGGPPCQGHSTLNNHTRGTDPKNGLYLAMVRAAEVLRPTAVLIENVPAVERDAARTLETAVALLKGLGYSVDHGVVSVADIGVPQLRRRHVLLAHRGSVPDVQSATNAACMPARNLRWAIGDLRPGRTVFDTAGVLSPANESRARFLLKHDEHDLPNARRPVCQRDAHKYKSMYGRLWWDQPAQTITTGFGSPGQGRYLHPDECRTLTPHEAARVQFFPDWFDFSPLEHRTELARAIGNAVPPKLGFVLARHLLTLDLAVPVGSEPAAPKQQSRRSLA